MDEIRALGRELSNWGRWGADDERGTVNFITPEKLVEAGRLIRRGKVFSLALDLDRSGPQTGAYGRFNPIHTMLRDGSDDLARSKAGVGPFYADDAVYMPLQCSTQWDALAHFWYDGRLYNGYPAASVTSAGAARNGIGNLAAGVASRGVLLDLARLKGVACLPPRHAIGPEDLEAAEAAAGVRVGRGDVLLVRTGAVGKWRGDGDIDILEASSPGLALACARWLHAREVAAVCADNFGVEAPATPPAHPAGLHMVGIRDMGLLLGELFALDELAADCAEDGVYEFFFAAPPLRIPKAVGSPINPLAIK